MYYKNLEAEMIRNDVTRQQIADELKIGYNTATLKLSGKNRLYYDEAETIKKNLFPKYEVDYLFKREEVK